MTRLLAPLVLWASMTSAQPVDLALVPDSAVTVDGVSIASDAVLGTDRLGFKELKLAALTAALPAGAAIDALDFFSPDEVYFSLTAAADFGGFIASDEDVLAWDGVGFTLLWDGSNAGIPMAADIDALDVVSSTPLVMMLSLDIPAILDGILTQDEDLVRFEDGGGFVALAFDGSAAGVPAALDVDALNVRIASEWLLSFDADVTLGGAVLEDGDIALFDPTGGGFATSAWFDASLDGAPSELDVNAIEATPGQVPVELLRFVVD